MNSPGYVLLLVAHTLCAVIGFGALGATGVSSARARAARAPYENEPLQRYFRPGLNLAGIALWGIPIFGGLLLVVGDRAAVHRAYPWIGLGCWAVVLGLATAVIWPEQHELRTLFATRGDLGELRRRAMRCERAVAVAVLVGLVALVAMLIEP